MKKYLDYQHIFFCLHMVFLLALGLLLARYDPTMAFSNAAICLFTILISNQVIYAFKRANVDYRLPSGLPELDIPGQSVAHYLMLASSIAQFYFPWSFDLHGFLNKPNLLPTIFFLYTMASAHQIWKINSHDTPQI
ncbi:hypothetical protein [Mesorhizobium sp. SP-1A]|uniref:hypothetical protein n=1 Tax=Mesorhizobium sp. SP-1A TaxID=3077840 RepID=UPI0028F71781|nr:hypothetical protein [Mesorhizobium sp. SP-1A]